LRFFVFELGAGRDKQEDGRTDGLRTDGRTRCIMRLIERPHHNDVVVVAAAAAADDDDDDVMPGAVSLALAARDSPRRQRQQHSADVFSSTQAHRLRSAYSVYHHSRKCIIITCLLVYW